MQNVRNDAQRSKDKRKLLRLTRFNKHSSCTTKPNKTKQKYINIVRNKWEIYCIAIKPVYFHLICEKEQNNINCWINRTHEVNDVMFQLYIYIPWASFMSCSKVNCRRKFSNCLTILFEKQRCISKAISSTKCSIHISW